MQVVAFTGAVGRRIVGAEDRQVVALAERDLGHVGEEVGGCADRVFAKHAAGMSTDRVEVAQDGNPPRRIRVVKVAQQVLDHQLRASVRTIAGTVGKSSVIGLDAGSP